MEAQGFVKIYRKMLDNPIIGKDSDHIAVWMYILLNATHKEYDTLFKGERLTLKPGQLLMGRKSISEKLKINESKVQRILKTFENEQQIEQQTSNKNRLVTVLNWCEYQGIEQQNEQQVNNKRTTTEQQVNTNKNVKNVKNIKNDNKELKDMSNSYESDFTIWWNTYPVKGSKQTALKSFEKQKANSDMDKLLTGTQSYISFQQKKGYDICMGSTFLNQRRWEGEWGDGKQQGDLQGVTGVYSQEMGRKPIKGYEEYAFLDK